MLCKKDVTTGFVLCGSCARKLEPFTLPADLAYFIDRLAGDIAQDKSVNPCHICSIRECSSKANDVTCQNGVKAWLLSKANQYFSSERRA